MGAKQLNTALIAGASGLIGNQLLTVLLSSKYFTNVVSIGRRKVPIEHPKLKQYIVDFDKLEELKIKVDFVFCCLGTTIKKAGSKEVFKKVDYQFPLVLIKYAFEMGAKSFHLVTAMGANAQSAIFYNKIKGLVEDEISKVPIKQIHIYRPSLLLGKREEKRFMEGLSQVVMSALGFLFIGSLKNYRAIKAERVAAFMSQSATSDEEGRFVHLSGEMQ